MVVDRRFLVIESLLTEHQSLTRAETARLCRVSVRTLERWARAGIGPRQIQVGVRQKRYLLDEVREYLRTGEAAKASV